MQGHFVEDKQRVFKPLMLLWDIKCAGKVTFFLDFLNGNNVQKTYKYADFETGDSKS